jgi:hypothetical protein
MIESDGTAKVAPRPTNGWNARLGVWRSFGSVGCLVGLVHDRPCDLKNKTCTDFLNLKKKIKEREFKE